MRLSDGFKPSSAIFSKAFLAELPFKYMSADFGCIDYMKLITQLCPDGNIIARVGGDGGGEEITFQMSCEKHKQRLLVSYLEQDNGLCVDWNIKRPDIDK